MRFTLIFLILFVVYDTKCSSDQQIARARVESCPGCSLNRLPEVRKFIFEDVPKYKNVEFKKIPGAPPELVLLTENDEEIERIELRSRNREQCNQLLKSKGFVIESKAEL